MQKWKLVLFKIEYVGNYGDEMRETLQITTLTDVVAVPMGFHNTQNCAFTFITNLSYCDCC
jgi:hypothetical protein